MKCKRKSNEERPEEIELTKGKACKKPAWWQGEVESYKNICYIIKRIMVYVFS